MCRCTGNVAHAHRCHDNVCVCAMWVCHKNALSDERILCSKKSELDHNENIYIYYAPHKSRQRRRHSRRGSTTNGLCCTAFSDAKPEQLLLAHAARAKRARCVRQRQSTFLTLYKRCVTSVFLTLYNVCLPEAKHGDGCNDEDDGDHTNNDEPKVVRRDFAY